MKTKTQKTFIAICIFNALLFQSSFAQIIYTDVIPDTTINGVYALDLNNDGIQDFNITRSTSQITGVCAGVHTSTKIDIMVTPLNSNEIGRSVTGNYPSALAPNSVINSGTYTWINGPSQVMVEKSWHCITTMGTHWASYYIGTWINASSKYLPLRLHVGMQIYYGWVRLNVSAVMLNLTALDYAYNSSPGQSILAGEPMPLVSSLPAGPFCTGSSISIPVFAQANYYNAGNKFIAQLSNSAGSFTSPFLLDSISAIASDTIFTTVPALLPVGTGYKVRIQSTDPVFNGPSSTASLSILLSPPAIAAIANTSPVGLDSVCWNHGALYLYAATGSGFWYQWYLDGVQVAKSLSNRYDIVQGSTATGAYTVVDSNACGLSGPSAPLVLFIWPVLSPVLNTIPPVCTTAPPFLLTGGLPAGGVYSGAGVNSATGIFDPALLLPGSYMIYYTVLDSLLPQCQAIASRLVLVNVCTGLDENDLTDVNVYARGKQILVRWNEQKILEGTLVISDLTGQRIRETVLTDQETEIDMTGCSIGIYFVTIQTDHAIWTRKIYLQ